MPVYSNRVWENQALSGTNTVRSLVTTVARNQADGKITYTVDFTETVATLTGTLTVELSAAHEDELLNDPNAQVAFQKYTKIADIAISGSGSQSITITQLAGGTRVQLKYVNATGSGTVLARVKSR